MSGQVFPQDERLEAMGVRFMVMVQDAFDLGEPHAIATGAAKALQDIEDWKED